MNRLSGNKNPALARIVPYVFLSLAVFLAYANIYHNEFLFDDIALIVNNQFLRDWRFLPALLTTKLNAGSNIDGTYYRPMQSLLYLGLFQMAGLSTIAFHLLNITLHAVNACLVYALGLKLRFIRGAVFVAALLWALHPLQTEAVTYMSATADTLYTLFLLLAMIAVVPDFSLRRFAVSAPLILLCLLSKEEAVIAPLLAMGTLYFFSGKKASQFSTYFRVGPWVAVVGIYLAVYCAMALMVEPAPVVQAQAASSTAPISYAPFASLALYARLILWPFGLHMEHDFPAYASVMHLPVLAGMGLIAVAGFQIMRPQSRVSEPFGWGLIWFAVALLPVFCGENIAYEHWLYVPLIGLFLGATQSIALYAQKSTSLKAVKRQRIVVIICTGCACALGFMTWRQNEVWHDPVALYSNVIASGEPAVKAHANLGNYYVEQGDLAKAMDEYESAVANSGDTDVEAQHNIGVSLTMIQKGLLTDEALAHFRRALAIDPNYYPTLTFLADTYAAQGNLADAAIYRTKADALQKRYKTFPGSSSPQP